jgi:hypothetical protein
VIGIAIRSFHVRSLHLCIWMILTDITIQHHKQHTALLFYTVQRIVGTKVVHLYNFEDVTIQYVAPTSKFVRPTCWYYGLQNIRKYNFWSVFDGKLSIPNLIKIRPVVLGWNRRTDGQTAMISILCLHVMQTMQKNNRTTYTCIYKPVYVLQTTHTTCSFIYPSTYVGLCVNLHLSFVYVPHSKQSKEMGLKCFQSKGTLHRFW